MEEKVFKISYHVNLITSMAEDEGTIMEAIANYGNSDPSNKKLLAIYKTPLVKNIIDYKWDTFGFATHRIGALMHFTYIACLQTYIAKIFLQPTVYRSDNTRVYPEPDTTLLIVLAICLLYPVQYDGTQFLKAGRHYFAEASNYIDICNIFFGYFNIYCQWSKDSDG